MSRFSSRQAPWRGSADFYGLCRRAPGCTGTRACSRPRRSSPSIGANLRSSTGSWRATPSTRTIIRSCRLSGSRLTTSKPRGCAEGPSAQLVSKNFSFGFFFRIMHVSKTIRRDYFSEQIQRYNIFPNDAIVNCYFLLISIVLLNNSISRFCINDY